MTNKSWHLHRRTFLRGMGSLGTGLSLGLPWLDCMAADEPKGSDVPSAKRFCAMYFGFGVSLPDENSADARWRWFPKQEGNDYEVNETLQPIQRLREHVSVLGGLSHPQGREMGAHDTGDTFLTGAFIHNEFLQNTVSVDQIAAMAMRDQTRFSSLVLSTDGGVGEPTRSSTLSYDSVGRPIPALNQPKQIYNRLFGAGDQDSITENRLLRSKSKMLDRVLEDSHSVRRRLGTADQRKLDEYLATVRQIEQGVERSQKWLEIPRPELLDEERDLLRLDADDQAPLMLIRTMYDLLYLAFRTDSTRVATYQITNMADASSKAGKFPQLQGFKSSLHTLAHDWNKPGGAQALGLWDKFMVEQYSYFLQRLADAPERHGSILDHSVILYGSSNSNTHNNRNYPLLLAGGQALGLKHGRYLRLSEDIPMSNLLLTMLNCVGVHAESFADSTGPLNALAS
ncbi:MAG: DUF1552 domain-containing protein [Planctomycetales bacterium]|nr:DUF1552 domain-containing protein [Planctomycetales bacterium]